LIFAIVRTSIAGLRRDRPSLALSFVLPITFFSIFASVFGGQHSSTPKVKVIAVDEDQSAASRQLVQALKRETSLVVSTQSETKGKSSQTFTAASAEAAVKAGDFPVALIIPNGFGEHPVSFGPAQNGVQIQLLNDSSDMIAPQVVSGLLQKAAMTAMPSKMAEQGALYTGKYVGGFTPEQQKRMDESMAQLRKYEDAPAKSEPDGSSSGPGDSEFGGIISVQSRAVVGENKRNPMISFYAAAIGVMFLLFTASGSAGALLDEAESGTLDRVLSSHVTMTMLLGGKLVFNTMLAFTQLIVMFLWARAVFHLDFFEHIPGFVVMGLCTAFAVASFGMLLASMCHTRAQLGAVSTLLILTMSAVGGSMFPRFLMPPAMQTAGLFTINGWAIDGFTKVFWRDLPLSALWPQVAVLLGIGTTLFLIARRIARRWEFA